MVGVTFALPLHEISRNVRTVYCHDSPSSKSHIDVLTIQVSGITTSADFKASCSTVQSKIMLHTLMEVDSYPTPFSSSKLRGSAGLSLANFRHHKPMRASKRERSPEESEVEVDRPLVCSPYALILPLS